MKLQQFVRDNAYYSALRDRGRTINAEDVDLQFNNLQNFINTKILPIIDGLSDQRLSGSKNLEDLECYLENIGDKNTRWTKPRFNSLTDHSLSWQKLLKARPGSVLASRNDRSFVTVELNRPYQLLTSNINDAPFWSFIKNDHFGNRSIDGSKVDYQTYGKEHLAKDVLGEDIDDNSINTPHIQDNAVTGPKIGLKAIDDSKISQAILNIRNNNAILGNKSINEIHLKQNVLDANQTIRLFFGSPIANNVLNIKDSLVKKITQLIPNNGISVSNFVRIYPQYHIANESIQLRHIKLQSFSFANLNPNFNFNSYYNYTQFLSTNHLSPKLKQSIGLN